MRVTWVLLLDSTSRFTDSIFPINSKSFEFHSMNSREIGKIYFTGKYLGVRGFHHNLTICPQLLLKCSGFPVLVIIILKKLKANLVNSKSFIPENISFCLMNMHMILLSRVILFSSRILLMKHFQILRMELFYSFC